MGEREACCAERYLASLGEREACCAERYFFLREKGGLLRREVPFFLRRETCCAERYLSSLGMRHAAQRGTSPP